MRKLAIEHLTIAAVIAGVLIAAGQFWISREQNIRTLEPVARFVPENHRHWLKISLRNSGVGPLRIEKLRFSGPACTSAQEQVIDCIQLPQGDAPFQDYAGGRDGWIVGAGEELTILHFEYEKTKPLTGCYMADLKRQLKDLVVSLVYRDLYNRRENFDGMPYFVSKDFSEFFGCLTDEDFPGSNVWDKATRKIDGGCPSGSPPTSCN